MINSLRSLLPSLKAIFFDLDDTLVFSEDTHTEAWIKCLPKFGIDPQKIDFPSLVGMTDMKHAKVFKELFNVSDSPETLWEHKLNSFLDLVKHGFPSPSGRDPFLEKVSQKYITGVVSSSPQKIIQNVLAKENIASFFHFIIGFEDCSQHKPDPLPYLNALALAKVEPHEALVIEDSYSGITSALKASIPVIGILKDQRPEQLVKNVPYFNNFEEIHEQIFIS